MTKLTIIYGNLLDQPVDVIVNPWNRNIIPAWLLVPQGVAGAIKKKAGYAPFSEVAKAGKMPLGSAVLTGAGKLSCKGIIHVAGINLFWRATKYSITQSVISVMDIVTRERFQSVAFPMIGAGTGGFNPEKVKDLMIRTVNTIAYSAEVILVIYQNQDQ